MIYKNLGETPLQALERLRESEGLGAEVKMTYAGRLDPLAEGELLILIGEECKQKEKYLGLDKEYEVEILLGAQTDTGDVMGKIIGSFELLVDSKIPRQGLGVDEIEEVLHKFTGKISWPYPAFSSKIVQGKPLFLWALEGKIGEVEIPVRESEIYELELLRGSTSKLSMSELREQVHQKINSIAPVPENIINGVDSKRLGADFRRTEVLASWADFFENVARTPYRSCTPCGYFSENTSQGLAEVSQTSSPLATGQEFEVIKIRCKCSSGTYMRTLAQKIGEELGTDALALSIVRTEIVVE